MQKETLQIQYNITLSLPGLITLNFYRISHPYIINLYPTFTQLKKGLFLTITKTDSACAGTSAPLMWAE